MRAAENPGRFTDTLWALELIIDWLEHADPDTLDDLAHFCGKRHRVADLEATIVRQAHTIRRALTALTTQGAAID